MLKLVSVVVLVLVLACQLLAAAGGQSYGQSAPQAPAAAEKAKEAKPASPRPKQRTAAPDEERRGAGPTGSAGYCDLEPPCPKGCKPDAAGKACVEG